MDAILYQLQIPAEGGFPEPVPYRRDANRDRRLYDLQHLTVMAPEIKGLWDFTIVPGTEMPDGTVNHEVASHTTSVMMLENADNKEAAWEFMKWWTSKETQIAYGREMEGLMGEAARYPTANIEALKNCLGR